MFSSLGNGYIIERFIYHPTSSTTMTGSVNREVITGIDKLLQLINEKQDISMTCAANALKVPKHIVEEWVDNLEKSGLISIRFSLREMHAVSLAYNKSEHGVIKPIIRNIKSIYSNGKTWDQEMVNAQKRELEARIAELGKKTAELRQYERIRAEADEKLEKLMAESKRLEIERTAAIKQSEACSRLQSMILAKQGSLVTRERELNEKQKIINSKEHSVNRIVKEVWRKLEAMQKERTALEKKKVRLSQYELWLSNQLIKGSKYENQAKLMQEWQEYKKETQAYDEELKQDMTSPRKDTASAED